MARGLGLFLAVLAILTCPRVAAAQLQVDRTDLEFVVAAGTNPDPQTFTITNAGTGSGSYTLIASDPRIDINPRTGFAGTTPTTITVSPTTDDLDTDQTYYYSIGVDDEPLAKSLVTNIRVVIQVYTPGPPRSVFGPAIEANVDEYLDDGASVPAGNQAWLFVEASGGTLPYSYQWRYATDGNSFGPVPDTAPAEGRNTNTLYFPSLVFEQEGFYRCDVSNADGGTTSSIFNLIVNAPPRITQQPMGALASVGGSAAFRVEATGSQPLSYHWYHAAPGSVEFAPLGEDARYVGATTPELEVPTVNTDMAGEYYVRVSNRFGEELSTTVTLYLVEPTTTPMPTPTEAPSPTATEAPTATPRPTSTPTPTATETPSPTATEAPSPTATEAPTATPRPTSTASPTITETASPTATEAPSPTATEAPTATPRPTSTASPTITETASPTATEAPSPTATEAPTATPRPTSTASPTATETATPTATEEPSPTATEAPTATPRPTNTATPTATQTASPTATPLPSPTATPAPSASPTATPIPTPFFIQQPQSAVIDELSSATLRVVVEGPEPLTFAWEFARDCEDFQTATDDGVLSGTATAELHIVRPSLANTGCYRCVVSSDAGPSFSNAAEVTVLARPAFSTQPTSYTLTMPGQPLRLHAEAQAYPGVSYSWRFALNCGTFVPLQDSETISGAQSDTLFISALTTDDEGCFKCVATNTLGESDSALAEVELLNAPIIRLQPQSVDAYASEAVSFALSATGSDPLVYTWQKRNGAGEFVPASGSRVGGQGSDSLFISNTAISDSGTYRCVVSNELGSVPSDEVQLTITDFPAEMRLSVTEIRAFAVAGSNAPAQSFTVSNVGGRPLDFTVTPQSAGWIAGVSTTGYAAPRGGTSSVNVTWSAASLAMGTYEGSLTVRQTGGSNREDVIPVTLMVVDAYTVTSLLDDGGSGTLRSILTLTNTTPDRQTIGFAVAGDIFPLSALPPLTDPAGLVLDGAGKVRLRGLRLTGYEDGIAIRSANNIVRNLTITEFPANGIRITGVAATANLVTGCTIGFSGQEKAGNRANGILISDRASNNTIGGREVADQNQISANSFSGIMLENASQNLLLGNQIGGAIDASGKAMSNGGNGVFIVAGASGSLENTLGGDSLFDRNLIAANQFFGRTVFALKGAKVTIGTSVSSADDVTFQWLHDGVNVGTDSESYTIDSATPADSGFYWCTITNSGGTVSAPPVYVLVASRLEMALQELLAKFSQLDKNGDGKLSLAEINGLRTKLFDGLGTRPLAEEDDFNALDENGDGVLAVGELVAGVAFQFNDPVYRVTPESYVFPEGDIDNGVAGMKEFLIQNMDTRSLDLLTTPELTNDTEWRYTADSGERVLPELGSRTLTVASDPAELNERAAYMNVRTDDFLVPLLPVLLTGFGYQTTPELNGTLTGAGTPPRTIGEVDVNGDEVFDAADTQTNINRGK